MHDLGHDLLRNTFPNGSIKIPIGAEVPAERRLTTKLCSNVLDFFRHLVVYISAKCHHPATAGDAGISSTFPHRTVPQINVDGSAVPISVIPTDEEREIAWSMYEQFRSCQ